MKSNNDKELIEGALICIKQIEKYFKGCSEKNIEKDWMLRDAVEYRLSLFGRLISKISQEFKRKHNNFYWFVSQLENEGVELAWDLYIANENNSEPYESLKSISIELKKIYDIEYNNVENKTVDEKFIDFDKYALRTKNSIWTVKKK